MKYCKKCNMGVTDNANYCPDCGHTEFVWTVDGSVEEPKRAMKAAFSLVFGILSIVLAVIPVTGDILMPAMQYVFAFFGIAYSISAVGAPNKGVNKAGLICSIIGLGFACLETVF